MTIIAVTLRSDDEERNWREFDSRVRSFDSTVTVHNRRSPPPSPQASAGCAHDLVDQPIGVPSSQVLPLITCVGSDVTRSQAHVMEPATNTLSTILAFVGARMAPLASR